MDFVAKDLDLRLLIGDERPRCCHAAFEIQASIQNGRFALAAHTARREIGFEYAEALRNEVLTRNLGWQWSVAVDADVHRYVV
jgi:hypothetical protein